jgi:hypothetical protein
VARAGPFATQPIGYAFSITTAYAAGDPFPNRLDSAFVEPYGTGYFQIQNTGTTVFTGQIGDIAVSVDAGDLSFQSSVLTLLPGQSVSVAIGDNSADVGGFNGPAYFYRPGVEITLSGTVTNGITTEPVSLEVADANIQSGVYRTDQYGLISDSFVLQGGDPWGFANATTYALTLADGSVTLTQSISEPAGLALLILGLGGLAAIRLRGGSPSAPAPPPAAARAMRPVSRRAPRSAPDAGRPRR